MHLFCLHEIYVNSKSLEQKNSPIVSYFFASDGTTALSKQRYTRESVIYILFL